ncbi:entericidin A/B family lipoprotein [Persicirhabdus sediminis]|uniref:Entericidin A/B family lipoprotein n=1 Tax=Persicirhabdus sediminis TaxID=454144 RepID=A0A8J7MED9_9BACT|nr:entericidin A/B family lipoprotein [Persicirhabdus sediminis]MBK1792384.1 entericidin A/B family lipoprotein [Persicirhabdus sediminis]
MKIALAITTVALCLVSTSCNTFIGMGRDIQSVGKGLSNTADKTQNN